MRNLIRRIATKLSSHDAHHDRSDELPRGPIVQMMVSDLRNLDSLTRALGDHRR
jgi:hypothetical protein